MKKQENNMIEKLKRFFNEKTTCQTMVQKVKVDNSSFQNGFLFEWNTVSG